MLSACGVSEYWTSTLPIPDDGTETETSAASPALFSGKLKERPEDFVVMEIDTAGQCTALDEDAAPAVYRFAPPPPQPAVRASPAQPSVTAHSTFHASGEPSGDAYGLEDGADAEEGVREAAREDVTAPAFVMAGLAPSTLPIGATLQHVVHVLATAAPMLEATLGTAEEVTRRARALNLASLSGVVLALFPSRCPVPSLMNVTSDVFSSPSPSTACWWLARAPLAFAPDKEGRRLVHMAVRHRYPHIRSRAEEGAGSAQHVDRTPAAAALEAAVDVHYVFLAAVLGEPVARLMAQWATMEGEKNASAEERALLAAMNAEAGLGAAWDAETPLSITATFSDVPATSSRLATAQVNVGDEEVSPHSGGLPSALPALSDKDVRRCFHELRKRFYPYVACTVQDGVVRLRYAPRGSLPDRSQRRRPREDDEIKKEGQVTKGAVTARPQPPPHGPDHAETSSTPVFTYILVRKRNVESAEMKKLLAEYLHVPEGSVCMAGMKDKKGITHQRCSVPGDHVARLTGVVAATGTPTVRAATSAAEARRVEPRVTLRWPSDPLGSTVDITHCAAHTFTAPIHIGELRGNRFRVRLRDVVWHNASAAAASAPCTEEACRDAARQALTARFNTVVSSGFLNFFGQQRFSESVVSLADHTGVHLFGHRYVRAVRSLYRSCPQVYDGFPEKMDVRAVPGNARDAQAMTHALRQTYRMYFSEQPLTREDVVHESALWNQICTKALCEGTAFSLRAMWVHAAQSLYFNICTSFAARAMKRGKAHELEMAGAGATSEQWLRTRTLPLAGYDVGRADTLAPHWQAAHAHACEVLELTSSQLLEQRRVAGVPVPGSQRAFLVFPTEAALTFEDVQPTCYAPAEHSALRTDDAGVTHAMPTVHCGDAVFSFTLPSSCYATIFLREVLGNSEWW